MGKAGLPGQDLPATPAQRILLVDDDNLELELMADRLKSLGFDTHTAADGSEALQLLQTQSFPVVITDWQMPRMDGIQLTESLRAKGDDETFIIMLTVLDDSTSHERGYFAGVDDYLSKRAPDAKIVAGVRAAFKAVEMRHALKAAKQPVGSAALTDVSTSVLTDRLRAELKRAARYHRDLSVLVLQLESEGGASVNEAMTQAVQVATAGVRNEIDFVSRYRGVDGVPRIAVLLPETQRSPAIAVGGRLCTALANALQTPIDSFTARVGCASFSPGVETQSSEHVTANIEGLLRTAEAGVRAAPLPSSSQPRHNEAR